MSSKFLELGLLLRCHIVNFECHIVTFEVTGWQQIENLEYDIQCTVYPLSSFEYIEFLSYKVLLKSKENNLHILTCHSLKYVCACACLCVLCASLCLCLSVWGSVFKHSKPCENSNFHLYFRVVPLDKIDV